jgi:hypothetical protein
MPRQGPARTQGSQPGAPPAQLGASITPEARAESLSYWRAFNTVHAVLSAPFAIIIVGVVLYGAVVEPVIRYIIGSTALLMLLIAWVWRRHERRFSAHSASNTPALHPK